MAAWYDTGDPTTADTTEDDRGGDQIRWWFGSGASGLVLPAGTVDSLRIYANTDTFGQGIKLALYDSSGNIVTGASGTNTSEGTGAGWKTVTFTAVSIAAGTYYVGSTTSNNLGGFLYAALSGQTSGTTFYHFGSTYAAFPPSSFGSHDSNRTTLLFKGAQVTPSAAVGKNTRAFPLGVEIGMGWRMNLT